MKNQRKPPTDLAASIKGRLLNLRSPLKRDYDQLLLRFANERILYRLSISQYREQFILKGAMMFNVWLDEPYRPTRDIDVLGINQIDEETLKRTFAEILAIKTDDPLVFDIDNLKVEDIREDTDYGGLRLRFIGYLGKGKIFLTIDIGFGDAIVPDAAHRQIPVLLDYPMPTLLTYPPETSVAEKFHAIVKLGATNSRVKDYGDIWELRDRCDQALLPRSIAATFKRRNTPIPTDLPAGLQLEYTNDVARLAQWETEKQVLLHRPDSFKQLITEVAEFIMPHAAAARAIDQ